VQPIGPDRAAVVSEAVTLWAHGPGQPGCQDSQRLLDRFGHIEGAELVPLVEALQEQFFESDAHLRVAGLSQMAEVAARRFRLLQPALADVAVDALANLYAFQYK
jgi:hypothetical protein